MTALASVFDTHLEDRLPQVRGRYTANATLAPMTWMGVGGVAEVLFKPADRQDLIGFMQACPPDVPVTVMGVMSNTIIRDGGIAGVVVRLGRDFAQIDVDVQNHVVTAGAMALDVNVAQAAARDAVAGLAFLSGIPGTIGGAVKMNAGAYGGEMKDILVSAEVLDRAGNVHVLTPEDLDMTYRHTALPPEWIVLAARLRGHAGVTADIVREMDDIRTKRAASQPIRAKTGGSTFANPPGHKAWQLIDAVGGRGLRVGGAQMSELHCNFMLNTGGATAADLERLGEDIRKRVHDRFGIWLRWEIRRVGRALAADTDIQALIDSPQGCEESCAG